MSEVTIQAGLIAALTGTVAEGSIVVNDFETPQASSVAQSPWLIVETSDEVETFSGQEWSDLGATYRPYVTLLSYRGGRTNKEHMDAFQTLRQTVTDVLRRADGVKTVTAVTPISPAAEDADNADPPSLLQRLMVEVTEYSR